jgi:hypothetical protein
MALQLWSHNPSAYSANGWAIALEGEQAVISRRNIPTATRRSTMRQSAFRTGAGRVRRRKQAAPSESRYYARRRDPRRPFSLR